MPKQILEWEPPMPPPGRGGCRSLANSTEHRLAQLAKARTHHRDFEAHPPASKPLDPANFGAEDMMRRATGGNIEKLGPDHPTTLGSFAELARLQIAQNRFVEAEYWLLRSFKGMKRQLGPNHPETLEVARTLAEVAERQLEGHIGAEQCHGDAADFRLPLVRETDDKLLRMSLALRRRIAMALEEQLGPEHPDTIEATKKLAAALKRSGHLDLAADLERVLEGIAAEAATTPPPQMHLSLPRRVRPSGNEDEEETTNDDGLLDLGSLEEYLAAHQTPPSFEDQPPRLRPVKGRLVGEDDQELENAVRFGASRALHTDHHGIDGAT